MHKIQCHSPMKIVAAPSPGKCEQEEEPPQSQTPLNKAIIKPSCFAASVKTSPHCSLLLNKHSHTRHPKPSYNVATVTDFIACISVAHIYGRL
jgi:hypothetical protein